jgi:Methyladenine glycosylase
MNRCPWAKTAKTRESEAMSKDLKRRGFKFVGSTICYAFMQAVGMVNDHLVECFRRAPLSRTVRSRNKKPIPAVLARRHAAPEPADLHFHCSLTKIARVAVACLFPHRSIARGIRSARNLPR